MGNESTLAALKERHQNPYWQHLPQPVGQPLAVPPITKKAAPRPSKPKKALQAIPPEGTDFRRILEAARGLGTPFTVNDLAVECWKLWPERFGMKSYHHPDPTKIRNALFGKRGLIRRGFLEEVEPGLYRAVKEKDHA